MARTTDDLVAEYLDRLADELADVPRARRNEIVEEVSEHIEAARAQLAPDDEAAVRTLLDRMGDPSEIAAEAGARRETERPRRRWVEVLAIVLLLVGGFFGGIGWIVGVVLLWVSDVWTTRDKLIGTLVVPFGLATPMLFLFLAGSEELCVSEPVRAGGGGVAQTTCTGGMSAGAQALWIAFEVVLFVAPLATAIYLGRRVGRRPSAASFA
jgi:HAAS